MSQHCSNEKTPHEFDASSHARQLQHPVGDIHLADENPLHVHGEGFGCLAHALNRLLGIDSLPVDAQHHVAVPHRQLLPTPLGFDFHHCVVKLVGLDLMDTPACIYTATLNSTVVHAHIGLLMLAAGNILAHAC